jgi:ribosomal subunit interface protein
MFAPVQISLRGIAPSNALQKSIVEKARNLERFYDRIMSCRVALTLEGGGRRKGGQFSVHVCVKVPGSEIGGTREHQEDLHVALREAFANARRTLEEYAREERALKLNAGA